MATYPGSEAARVLVVGAGAWGSALANVFARAGSAVTLWDADSTVVAAIAASGHHPRWFTDVAFHPQVTAVSTLGAVGPLDCAVFVVPFQVLAGALASVREAGVAAPAIACASKGFALDTRRMAHEIVADAWSPEVPFAQLSGPNFATEVMHGAPAAITIGASTAALGALLTRAMHGSRFRPYCTDDVIGVEIGGALKNVIAIAAGIADGLALGSNTRAALITRGLAEIARFGVARGGRTETFMGLSGMGDLVLTCTDDQSRNRRFGLALARHGDVDMAVREVGALVEGVATAHAVAAMAAMLGIEMPIVSAVAAVLDGERSALEAVDSLLNRDLTSEAIAPG
ncbi:MAG: NAD(P)H-dependent glycerol-3-phosphate dehydrogenase [Gammaproteobacteria bacterium]